MTHEGTEPQENKKLENGLPSGFGLEDKNFSYLQEFENKESLFAHIEGMGFSEAYINGISTEIDNMDIGNSVTVHEEGKQKQGADAHYLLIKTQRGFSLGREV